MNLWFAASSYTCMICFVSSWWYRLDYDGIHSAYTGVTVV